MGTLTQVTLLSILHTMVQDEDFVESLAECIKRIFDISPPNPKTVDPFEILVDRMIEYFDIHTGVQKVQIPGLRSTLIGMLKEKQFLAFARILRMLKDLLTYPDARIINYLRQLKFRTRMDGDSISPWIDVFSTSEAVIRELNPAKLDIFAELSREEKCLLQGFASEQIAVISKFSPRGIVTLSELGQLPPNQRSMILGLNLVEGRLFKNLGSDKIRLISGLRVDERDKIFRLEASEVAGKKGQARLDPEELNTLHKLIEREAVVIQSMTERAGTLAECIHDLTVTDRANYLHLSPKEMDVLNNLDHDHRNVVLSIPNLKKVLNILKNLHSSQRYLILSLHREALHALLGNGYRDDFYKIQRIIHRSPMIIQRFSPLPIVEQDAILMLNKQQRSVLSRAYALDHDGLFMIQKLGPVLTSQVLSRKKELNVMQTALKNKLARMNFDVNILPQLFEIMEHESQVILLNLSWKGIKLLSRTADLDEDMIGIVGKLSNDGMEVLMNNDQMTGAVILMLGSLGMDEGNVLMNLDVKQRSYLSDRPDLVELPRGMFNQKQLTKLRALSNEAELVLERIVLLSHDEQLLFKGLQEPNTAVLTTMLPEELNTFASLTSEKLHLLSSFMVWRFGEDVVFQFLRMPLGTSYEDQMRKTRRIVIKLTGTRLPVDQHNYIPLIAGAIEVLRLSGVVTDNYVEKIPPLMEELTHMTTLPLIFRVNLLKFSVRDSTSLVSQLTSQIEGTEDDIMVISQSNRIRTIEDLMFIRWILSSSSIMDKRGLFGVGRGSLIQLSHDLDDGHELETLFSESTAQLDGIEHKILMKNFKHMLSADRYLLSSFLFITIGSRSNSQQASFQVSKLFEENFDADQCFQFLNTPAYEGFLHGIRDGGLPNMLSDGRFPNPTIFEVCLYYNRGNVLALSEKLDEDQLWMLLENRPMLLLRMMTRNVQHGLIKLFGRVAKVRQVWEESRMEIYQSFIEELTLHNADFIPEKYLHIARGIRRLAYWPLFLGTDTYVSMISEYTRIAQERVSRRMLRNLLDSFVSEDVSREYLITAVEQRLGNELVVPLQDRVRTCCNVLRRKRAAGVMCVDSKTTKDISSKAKQRIIQSVFDDTQTTLYVELLEYSELKFRGKDLDPQVQRDLISRMKSIPLDSLDPRIGDIVATLDDPQKFDTIVKQSGILNKIEKVASTTGLAFTLFFVGKHLAHGDIESLEYDGLNLLILPKIGEQIAKALEKSNPLIGSVIGTTVSNFAAFLGLVDSIIARKDAVSEVDQEIADLNIVTNAVFIAANIPTVATRILGEFDVEIAVLGELNGPVSAALTVSVVIGSYLISAGLQVEKVTDHIQLSFWEKLSLYWGFFLDQPVPENFEIDMLAKSMYTEYISNHLSRLDGTYDNVAVSLPSFLITERECVDDQESDDCARCTQGYKNTTYEINFSHRVRARYPFSTSHHNSQIIPENIHDYDFVCGPTTKDAIEKMISQSVSHTCPKWSRQLKELFIPSKPNDDCRNIVSFRKHRSLNSSKTFFYVASDASIELSNANSLDIVFYGRNISIVDGGITGPYRDISVNRYYFLYQPNGCSIHKRGHNFFYIVGETFECDLGYKVQGQYNTIVIKSDFNDSSGIHSIVGSEHREKIKANFAEFIDGSGGGDIIQATQNTIVKGHVNDFIMGDCTVMLPFNVNEIAKLVAHTRMIIYNQDGLWIEVDGNARIMTADYYLLTPIRTSNVTLQMVRAHIRKTFKHRISIEEELPVLRNLKIPNCNLVKQITSVNYNVVYSDCGQNVFNMDENGREYYWEAAERPGNLYIFRKMFAKVVISNASGILDFREFKISDRVNYRWSPEGGIEINIGGLHVSLLPQYGRVRITFDGKKYFKLGRSSMCREWCSHSLSIVGRVFIDGTDFHNYYNCFEFQSYKILFWRLENHLVLVTNKGILTITKYYSHLHEEIELSLKLGDGKIIEAPMFRNRADQAHRVIYYEVGGSELQIYHNQPVDEHHVGYVDLEHQSINDVEITIDSGGLILLYRNSTLVRIENWDHYEPARNIMFAFKDSFLPNAECILSTCDPEDIIEELKMKKRERPARNKASRRSSWINDLVNAIINPIRDHYASLFHPVTGIDCPILSRRPNQLITDFCTTSNVNLVLLLLQNFLDRRFPPLPRPPIISMVETLANVINLIDESQHVSSFHGCPDSFQLYSDIAELVRN